VRLVNFLFCSMLFLSTVDSGLPLMLGYVNHQKSRACAEGAQCRSEAHHEADRLGQRGGENRRLPLSPSLLGHRHFLETSSKQNHEDQLAETRLRSKSTPLSLFKNRRQSSKIKQQRLIRIDVDVKVSIRLCCE